MLFLHYLCLALAVKYFLDSNGLCSPGVNDAFVFFDRDEHPFFIKHRPMVTDHLIKVLLECQQKVGQVHVGTHLGFVFLGDEWKTVQRVNGRIKIWLGMPKFPKDWAAIHTMKHMVVLVGLVGEPAVIERHVERTLAAFWLGLDADW